MSKRYIFIILEVIAAVIIYYILSSIIENRLVLLGAVFTAGVIVVVIRLLSIKNDADLLDINIETDKFYESIKRFEYRDKNRYNTLLAYGLSYEGEYDLAEQMLQRVIYEDIRTSKNLRYDYYVTKLHILYNNKDRGGYQREYDQALKDKVFYKVEVIPETFSAHLLILDGKYQEAEQLLIDVIPNIRKRVLVIELEYLLAYSYFKQNKLEDCKAVCKFVDEKNYKVAYTSLCRDLLKQI